MVVVALMQKKSSRKKKAIPSEGCLSIGLGNHSLEIRSLCLMKLSLVKCFKNCHIFGIGKPKSFFVFFSFRATLDL